MVALIGIGGSELLLILGAALVLLGPRRLPEIARQLGKVSNQLRDANRDLQRELYANMDPPPPAARADGVPAPRPAARQIETGDAAPPPAVSDSDYDAPYRDAEAESQRAGAERAAGTAPAESAASAAPEAAASAPVASEGEAAAPSTQKADPDESGSAS